MPITPDQIIDRINLKKQVSNWRTVAIICVLLMVILTINSKIFKKVAVIDDEYIARIKIEGIIFDSLPRIENLKQLAKDKSVKAIILHVNSHGGTVVGGENLYTTLRKVAKDKPLAVIMGDLATSAGYMISTASDHIVAHESTITGSIGVIAQSFEVTELAEKIGIKFHDFKSSPLKGGPLPTEKLTPQMQKAMDETINDIYEMFIGIVSLRRDIPLQTLINIADGRVYTGRQAFKLKLVDELGDEDNALQWLKTTHKLNSSIKVLDYEIDPQESNLDKFFGTFSNISYALKILFNNNLTYFF